jgi:hypothetical protein
MEEGRNHLREMKSANDLIPDKEITAKIDRMQAAAEKIFCVWGNKAGKGPPYTQVYELLSAHYGKAVRSYASCPLRGCAGKNIRGAIQSIDKMLGEIAEVFEKRWTGFSRTTRLI